MSEAKRKFKVGDRVRVVEVKPLWSAVHRMMGVDLDAVYTVVGLDRSGVILDVATSQVPDGFVWVGYSSLALVDRPTPFAQAFIADIDARGGLDNIGDDALEVLGGWYAKAKEVEK